jgi:hypothetical protein
MKKNPARRLGLREHEIDIDMIGQKFVVIVGAASGVKEYVRWRFDDDKADISADGADACVYTKPEYAPILWMPRRPRTAIEIGTLAHEAAHVVKDIMDCVGIPFADASEEAYSHALGFVVRSVLEELRK